MADSNTPCPIPPIPDPVTGAPTCPNGFYYDPVQQCCIALIHSTVNLNDPCQASLLSTVANQEIDFNNMAQLQAEGFKKSNIIERFIVALLEIPLMVIAPLISLGASVVDDALTILSKAFLAAQGEHASGFYRLAGALMEDMLNIQVDGERLAQTFASGGRVAAMRELGGKLVDTLAGEFLGVNQVTTGGAFSAAPGTGLAGLPDATLSEAQGFSGLKAFVGFMTAFAVREGNTDLLASLIPHGYGNVFKDFAEDFSKNVGIGRLGRVAWKPLVSIAIATPVQWALNSQYRPALLDVANAFRANLAGVFDDVSLHTELMRHGLSEKRIDALRFQHLKTLERVQIRDLHVGGFLGDQDYSLWNRRAGFPDEVTALLDQAEDYAPARSAALRAADSFAQSYLHGRITSDQFHQNVLSVAKNALGQRFLSEGEVSALQALEGIGVAGQRRHLSIAMLTRNYIDGLLTLNEFSDAVTALGYSPDDVQLMEQELLILAKRAADKAAHAAAAAARGVFAKLTVAQMKTAYTEGIMTLDQVRAELQARQYAPSAIDAIASEFLVAAKLRPVTPPSA